MAQISRYDVLPGSRRTAADIGVDGASVSDRSDGGKHVTLWNGSEGGPERYSYDVARLLHFDVRLLTCYREQAKVSSVRTRELFNRSFRFAKTYLHAFVRSRELLHCLNVPYIWHPGLASTVSTLASGWYKGIAPQLPSSQPSFMDFMIGYLLPFSSSHFM